MSDHDLALNAGVVVTLALVLVRVASWHLPH